MNEGAILDGRYRVESTLGHGGMAVVYLVHDLELDRRAALKLLREELACDEAFRTRFARECRLSALLDHPNVVAVYGSGTAEGRPYLVAEYVDGETVAARLARTGRLEPEEAACICAQACAGLAHAHALGLVHRDVNPRNLLLRRDGVVKVADFGIACALEATRVRLTGAIVGTAAYLAPEQVYGGELGPAADVYGLGATLYELVTGRTPHDARTLPELVARLECGAVRPPSQVAASVPPPSTGWCCAVSPALPPSVRSLRSSSGRCGRWRLAPVPASSPLQHR